MPLINRGQVIDDPWLHLEDDDDGALPAGRALLVGLARWQQDQDALLSHDAPLGILLGSDQSPVLIADALPRLSLVVLDFPRFADGRPYSYARLLRSRYGFTGELRAQGNVLRDQLLFMDRCGFDSFDVADPRVAAQWVETMAELSVWYQDTGDGRPRAATLRGGASAAA